MPAKERKNTAKQKPRPKKCPQWQGLCSLASGKKREDWREGWKTQLHQVIKVPGGAVLRGCKKTPAA
ncbi:hypothetical protein HaLaN_18035 [Haematococcus lacustris]|uniref:Uncharacterized protein n=1 Tax=Haematococcus lacustris TaxID=44745 RepID=A0A699ZE06_HAELA|nr:hypothetical protein HaLaN_18035 [Haematococcus lacustris]